MRFSPAFLDDLRGRVTLSTLIGRAVKVTRAGREYKACCPFHNEKTPSFTINDDKGFYHCFGCSAHGDAIRWLTDHDGLQFVDAVEQLCGEAGVEVPQASPEAARRADEIAGQRPTLEAAQGIFRAELAKYPVPRHELSCRGIDEAVIDEFGIGFAPEDGALRDQGFNRSDLMAVGLIGRSEGGFVYVRFKSRIMVPIHDHRGRIVGFGGRDVPQAHGSTSTAKSKDRPKYVNSPESAIFDKGRTLFNLHRARELFRATRRLLILEGYFDVVALHRLGLAAVAPMGTALTEGQLERAWQVDNCPLLLFDGDAAGMKAQVRAAETALPHLGPGKSLTIGTLPKGQDPDDLVRDSVAAGEDPAQALAAWLTAQRPKPLQAVLRDAAFAARDGDAPESWAAVWQQLKAYGEQIRDADIRHLTLKDWRTSWEIACGFDDSAGDGAIDKDLLTFIERVERLDAEIADIRADRRDVRSEAKAHGYDMKAFDAVLRARRQDRQDRIENEEMIVVYRDAVGLGGPLSAAMRPSPLAEPVARKSQRKSKAPPPVTRQIEAMTNMIEGRV